MQPVANIALAAALAVMALPAHAQETNGGRVLEAAPAAAYDDCEAGMPPALGKIQEIADDWMRTCLHGDAAITPEHPDTAPLYEACRLEMKAASKADLLVFHLCVADRINSR